jgi:hypothetical protein
MHMTEKEPKLYSHGGRRAGAGSKKVTIDLYDLERLCRLNCTDQEIADFFGVTRRLIASRRKSREKFHFRYTVKIDSGVIVRERDMTFAEIMDCGHAHWRIWLRGAQFRAAEAGSARMLIWLGKNLLGQSEPPAGKPVLRSPLEMTTAELLQFAEEIPDDPYTSETAVVIQ